MDSNYLQRQKTHTEEAIRDTQKMIDFRRDQIDYFKRQIEFWTNARREAKGTASIQYAQKNVQVYQRMLKEEKAALAERQGCLKKWRKVLRAEEAGDLEAADRILGGKS